VEVYYVVRKIRVPAVEYRAFHKPVIKSIEFPDDAIITEITIEPFLYPLETLTINITLIDQEGTPYYLKFAFSSKDAKSMKTLTARDFYVAFGERAKPLRIKRIEFSAISNMERILGHFMVWVAYYTSKPEPFCEEL
jgi:hypothetical protein